MRTLMHESNSQEQMQISVMQANLIKSKVDLIQKEKFGEEGRADLCESPVDF